MTTPRHVFAAVSFCYRAASSVKPADLPPKLAWWATAGPICMFTDSNYTCSSELSEQHNYFCQEWQIGSMLCTGVLMDVISCGSLAG